VAKLTDEEQQALDKLIEKQNAPEAPAGGARNVDILIDLGDEAAVERGISLGLLTPADVERHGGGDDDDDGDGKGKKKPPKDDPDGGAPPQRRGYFEGSAAE